MTQQQSTTAPKPRSMASYVDEVMGNFWPGRDVTANINPATLRILLEGAYQAGEDSVRERFDRHITRIMDKLVEQG